ncbi:hypothetical protein [Sphingomonas bacterium]|uniref:hypothetical protein n=1 Tax=Sphingomonas bacterium TaxID=1895847 RepID=UPI002614D0C4|nr:hypothetical protein [Sphingomonas bacterium]MDB5680089.1 hypothetical protein [Sphingomonas bacterium]
MQLGEYLSTQRFTPVLPAVEDAVCGVDLIDIPCRIINHNKEQVVFSYLGQQYQMAVSDIVAASRPAVISGLPGAAGLPALLKVRAQAEISVYAPLTAFMLAGCKPAIFTLPDRTAIGGTREIYNAKERVWLLENGICSEDELDRRKLHAESTMTTGDSPPDVSDTTCWGTASDDPSGGIHIDDSHTDDTTSTPTLDDLHNDDPYT